MPRCDRPIAAALLASLLAGCATRALEMAPVRPDRPWTPAVSADGEIVAGSAARAEAAGGFVLPANRAVAPPPPPARVESGRAYALAELIDLAESSNPDTRIVWNEARKAALAAGVAESAYLPKIAATVAAASHWTDGHTDANGANAGGDHSGQGVVSAVTMQWLLFDFGERSAVVEAAKQGSVISNIAFTAAHQRLIHEVTLAYHAHAAARARQANASQALTNAQDVQAAAEARYSQRVGTVIEVAQARQATAQAKLAAVEADGVAEDTYLGLLTAMGVSPLTKIRLADDSDRKLTPAVAGELDQLVAQSLQRRPDVLAAFAAQRARQAGVRAAQAEFKPKVFMAGSLGYSSGGVDISGVPSPSGPSSTLDLNGHRFAATVFAGVTIPLYDGGVRSAALARARADADSAAARLTSVRDEAIRQIVSSNNTLRSSLAAHQASQALAAAAQTTYDGALAAYRGGVGSITDLTLAETQLLHARTATSDAYNAALSAAATLAFATGELGRAPD
jgi:outer membrane protein